MEKGKKRVNYQYQTELQAKSADIFPLLCPVREYDWIPQWHCDMVFSTSGVAERGCVFATDFGDGYGRETWVVYCYEPPEKIGFIRTGLRRTTLYEVSLQSINGKTTICWKQEITALDTEGDVLVGGYSEENFTARMSGLCRMLDHYLKTGKPLEMAFDITAGSLAKERGE